MKRIFQSEDGLSSNKVLLYPRFEHGTQPFSLLCDIDTGNRYYGRSFLQRPCAGHSQMNRKQDTVVVRT